LGNSTVTIGDVVAWGKSFPDVASIIQMAAGGSSLQPSLAICNDVLTEMLAQVFNWPWNRAKYPLFYTNSWQQDYASNVVNLGWLENGVLVDINNTALPKPIWPAEAVKDLPMTSAQYGIPGQFCWFPNDQLQYAVWPGASTTYTQPLGVNTAPANPITQIQDPNGNFWLVTTYGTTGTTQPTWPTTLTYPTQNNPTQAATTVTDGSVVWTAINPKGQGIRCNPIPPQQGVVYQFNLFYQYRPFTFSNGLFTKFSQTIEPIPDDYSKYFKDGFIAMAYAHSSDKGVRGKFQDQYKMWKQALMDAKAAGDRERENYSFYPSQPIISSNPYGAGYAGPAMPYNIGGW
jgi:hypothetical protein